MLTCIEANVKQGSTEDWKLFKKFKLWSIGEIGKSI